MTLLLAMSLGASVLWGCADFLGGRAARGGSAFVVLAWMLGTGAVGGVALLAVVRPGLTSSALWIALAAGLMSSIGIGALYVALSRAPMGVVAPVTACGAVVPASYSFARGEPVGVLFVVGLILALTGAVLVARTRTQIDYDRRPALAWTGIAAGGLGIGATLLQEAVAQGASGLAVGAVARVAAGFAVLIALLLRRSPVAVAVDARFAVVAGLADASAMVLYASASGRGHNAAVAVVGSLYPVFTVLLAAWLLDEYVRRQQVWGIAAALIGVALLALR